MSFANRYSSIGRIHARSLISEADVLRRTLTAIRTLKAMPDRERRFLTSGSKSFLATLGSVLTWHDANAHEDTKLEPLERVCEGPVRYMSPTSRYVPEKEQEGSREQQRPSRADISDAMIAGEWFAKLALLPENIDEFEARVDLYRQKKRRSPQVGDQEFMTWLSLGWTLKSIGERLKLNENQAERRGHEISRNLWRIANGTARVCDIDDRRRERERAKARHVASGARA